jgi:hypothetical protein
MLKCIDKGSQIFLIIPYLKLDNTSGEINFDKVDMFDLSCHQQFYTLIISEDTLTWLRCEAYSGKFTYDSVILLINLIWEKAMNSNFKCYPVFYLTDIETYSSYPIIKVIKVSGKTYIKIAESPLYNHQTVPDQNVPKKNDFTQLNGKFIVQLWISNIWVIICQKQ